MGWQLALMAAGTAISSANQQDAARENAGIMRQEGTLAAAGYNQNYAMRLRKNAVLMGANTAAAVQSGGGVGGSTKGVLDQNAVNMELDALNEKYQGQIRRSMYNRQATFDENAGSNAAYGTMARGVAGFLSAGGGSTGWAMGS